MRNEETETEGTEEALTYPLAWSAQGEPMDVPDEAVAWRVRRHKIGAQGGAPEVVWSQGKPLVLGLEATLEELIERVDGKPGRYRLDPIDDTGKPLKAAPSAYAVIEKQIDLTPAEQPAAAPRVDPVLTLLERKEQQIEHLTTKLTEIASALAAQQAPMMAANAAMLVPPGRPIEVQMPAMQVQAEAKSFDFPAFFSGLLQALPMLAPIFPKLLPQAPAGGTPTGGTP
jgi:hypothetical protein